MTIPLIADADNQIADADNQKLRGGYYMPSVIAEFLAKWAI